MSLAKRRRIVDPGLLHVVSRMPCTACHQWPEEQLRDYMDALRAGVKMERLSDPHHLTSRGAGGGDTPENVVALCRDCHNAWDAPGRGPSRLIASSPRLRLWLEAAGRQDILDRYALQPPAIEASQTKEEKTMTASAVNPRPNGTLLDKEIAFPLTVAQTAEKAQEMAALDAEITKLELEKKESDAKFSAQIKERYARLSAVAQLVRDRKEVRLCSVVMEKIFATNTVAFWHSEDGKHYELVEERPMEASERQVELDDAGVSTGKRTAKPDKAKRAKQKAGAEEPNEIAEEIKSETNRKTKRSAVDGVYNRET